MLGLSQDMLAKRVGITFQQIQKYERGVNSVSAWRLLEFSKVLEVSPMYFYEPLDSSNAMPEPISNEAFRLIGDFNAIGSARVRQNIAALVRELAQGVTHGL